jgi:hypothetical protein
MGQTYASRIAKAKRYSITNEYVAAAARLRGLRGRLVMCPYCNAQDTLVGSVQQKGRRTAHDVPLRLDGHALSLQQHDGSSILIATCGACGKDLDPLAYCSPYAFALDRASADQKREHIAPWPDDL